jgi:hypothetical protein
MQHRITTSVLGKMTTMLLIAEERQEARTQQLYALIAESLTGQRSNPPRLDALDAKWKRTTETGRAESSDGNRQASR